MLAMSLAQGKGSNHPRVQIRDLILEKSAEQAVIDLIMDPIERAEKGDADFFRRVEVKAFADSRDKDGDSVLSVAVFHNQFDCCKVILEKFHELLYIQNTSRRNNALHYAVRGGEFQIVQLLIVGADKRLFRMLNIDYNSPMHFAVLSRAFDKVKLLIEADPNYEFTGNKQGETPFMIASRLAAGKSNDDVEVKIRDLLLQNQPGTEKAGGETTSNRKKVVPTARESELSIPLEHLDLHRRLVKEFGEIVPLNVDKFMIGPMSHALANSLAIVAEMLVATPNTISREKISEWERMYESYTRMGLQIGWFPQRISLFSDWLSRRSSALSPTKEQLAKEKSQVELKSRSSLIYKRNLIS